MLNEEDVDSGSSPEQPEQQSADSSSDQQASPAEPAPQPAKEEQPFHMHPRFQEVIAEKNQLRDQIKQLQRQFEEQQARAPKPEVKVNPIRDRLSGIDKEFAEYVGSVEKIPELEQQLNEFKQWRQEQAINAIRQEASSLKEKFFSENSVPQEHRKLYEAQVKMISDSDPSLQVSDLPKVMKAVHEELSKLFKSTERAATKQLVAGKQADASKPSTQPKGAPAKAGKNAEPVSKADMRAQLVKDALAEIRAAKDI